MNYIISQEYLDRLQKTKEIEGVYLANSLQQGFIYHALNQGDYDDAYIIQLIWCYQNKIEVNNLKQAWSYAQVKYQSLRIRFGWEEELIQIIDKTGDLDWRYIDLTNEIQLEKQEQEIRQIQERDRLDTYKLDEGNLFRLYLIKQREDLYTCIFSNHHAILDGWSTPILLGYVHETYCNLQNKKDISVSIDYSYRDAQRYLSKHKDDNNIYWDRYVSQIEKRSDLSYLLSSGSKHVILSEYKHIKDPKELILHIQDRLYCDLKKLSQEEGITLNTMLQYVWHKVLSVYGRNNQTVVGTTISGRGIPIDNVENSVGLYINTLPLIVDHKKQGSVVELLKEIQNNINEINSRSNINLASLQKRGERLFDSLFIYQNYPSASNTQQDKILKVKFKEIRDKLDYPLGIVAYESNNQLTIKLKYAGELFSQDTIYRLLSLIRTLLTELAADCHKQVKSLNYLNPEQYNQIVYSWNNTDKAYPDHKTIHQLFEEQVAINPDNIAIVYEEIKLTYNELNLRANQLANHLIQHYNIQPDSLIALCLTRSEHMLIAILAVLKSGGAYVPINPSYPGDRIKYILKDTNAKLVLTNQIYKISLEEIRISKQQKVLAIDSKDLQKQLSVELASNPITEVKNVDLAYIIYTSGTTGSPKGVMIEHRSVINYVFNIKSYNLILPGDKVDFSTNAGFDLTVTTTICALCSGSEVVIYKNELLDLEVYKDHLCKTNVNVVKLVPSYFELLINYLPYTRVNKIILGGEKLSVNIINKLRDLYSNQNFNLTIWDEYGPTEATVGACNSKVCLDHDLTIGKPYHNYTIFVLDDNLTPLPIGAIGELYIGGIGLARGYLNMPDLTNEKFITNPFQTREEKRFSKNTRLYKTGDLVRWLPDGNIEYIGRNDFQVKIRGYRIELEEIENVISSYDGVKQSVVVDKKRKSDNIIDKSTDNEYNNSFLIGYYVSESKLDEEDVISFLQKKLPEYMIPSVLVYLKKLPLTINGKLDKKALPEPEFSNVEHYMAPRNELEKQICEIWADTLGLAQADIGINTNFFDLGGNSILIIRLKIKIEKNLNIKNLNVSDLFKYPTIKALSDYLFIRNTVFTGANKTKNINNSNNLEKDIAVIGMSGAFSSSEHIEEYWNNIVNGKECLDILSKEDCKEKGVLENIFNDKNFVPVSGVVKDIDKFDPSFWNLSFNNSVLMDPQIRKFLEHSWITLEKSGHIKNRKKIKIGVFAGMSSSQYYSTRIQDNQKLGLQVSDWEIQNMNDKDYLSTRVSYCLGLTGISLNINTACSTSLVAIVEACKSLSIGTCDVALAGGVSFSMPESHGYIYQDGMILSKDGHCLVFDKDSTGTVPGAGIGVIALKRLKNAIRDNDSIIAVVKGYAANNDGNRKVGYTAPSVVGQTECILRAQNMAKITSDTIDYVECHGTGTSLGDPIEIAALHDAFKSNSKQAVYSCILGAVKANIGHADSAAGVAGFIKVCKMLQEKIIPPQINFKTPNSNLHLEHTNFKIVTTAKEWLNNHKNPRRAGVSSFGIGGTNAHVIIEEYTRDRDNINKTVLDQYYILPISAKSTFSYQYYCEKLLEFLESKPEEVVLENIAYTLQYKREDFCYRNILVCKDRLDAIHQLKQTTTLEKLQQSSPDIIFMFSGQGVQYQGMAKNLYNTEPIFRNSVDECCKIISSITKISFKDFLYPQANNKVDDYLKETKWAQPALFTICYSLAKLLESFSINASAYIGHSIGEYAAATLSGVFSLEDALKAVVKRGELMQKMPKGSMISVNMSAESIYKILPDNLEIAVYNSPEYVAISGKDKDIELFKSLLDRFDVKYLELYTSHAFHSKMMDEAAKEFEQYLRKYITLNKPNKRFISNVTGGFISNQEAASANYWASHIRKSVQFSQGIERLIREYKNSIFLEIGPGKGLSTFVSQHKNDLIVNSISTLPSIKEFFQFQVSDCYQFYKSIGQLWCYGYDINWEKVWKTNIKNLKFSDIPTYQFEKNNCWIDAPRIVKENKLQNNSSTEWLYQLAWKRVEKIFTPANKKLTIKKGWLIFKDKLSVLDSFIDLLNSNNQIVIVVDYSELNENILIQEHQITINLYNESHYMELAEYLAQSKYDISYIIHGWTITSELIVANSEFCQYIGFYSLFLLQDKLFPSLEKEVKLILLTNGLNKVNGQELIYPSKGTILGAVKVIPHEIPKFQALTLDIGFGEDINDKYLLSIILNTNNYTLEPNFSIRGSYLWKEEIEPICISNHEHAPIINNNDLILISGGLGGVGLAIAKEISKHHEVKFILLNRQGIGGNHAYKKFQLDGLEFIRNNNCEVEIHSCDISNFSEISELIDSIKAKYGKINGVIHAAGGAPLNVSERNLANIKNAIKGKVLGAENLFNILRKDSLKFFVMTSSLASLMGDIGRLEYCAANSYLDVLSNLEADNIDNLVSINWPGWSNIGMSIKSDTSNSTGKSTMFESMSHILNKNTVTENEGAEIFYKLINQKSYNQIAISKFDILSIKMELLKIITDSDSKFNNQELTNILIEENSTELENKIAQIFYQIFGHNKFSKHSSYFELGGDSLSAIKLINKLNKELNINVTMTIIFKQDTVAKLAIYANSKTLKKENQVCAIDEGEI